MQNTITNSDDDYLGGTVFPVLFARDPETKDLIFKVIGEFGSIN